MDGIVPLSPAQRRYMWLRATGHDESSARRTMGATNTYMISQRAQKKLGANTLVHAVFIACQLDMFGPREECGTMPGVRTHQDRGEDLCRACRRMNIEYTEAEDRCVYEAAPELTGPERRLLGYLDDGLTLGQIIEKWGRTTAAVTHVRRTLYRKLGVHAVPFQQRRTHALAAAHRFRLLTPPDPGVAPEPRRSGTQPLTDLEVRTLATLAGGRSLAQAGKILGGIAGAAVSARLARIYEKLDVLHYGHGDRRDAAIREARGRGYTV